MSNKKVPRGTSVKKKVVSDPVQTGLCTVDIGQIIEDPKNERKTFRNMDNLVASVRRAGIVEPITVTSEGDQYKIITGHRRFRAGIEAGLTSLEVVVRCPEQENERRLKSLMSNIQHEGLNVIEMVEGLDAHFEDAEQYGSQREFAEALGKSESWLSDMMAIKRLPLLLQEKLRISEVPVPYDTVARIARVDDKKKQAHLVDLVLAGVPTSVVRQRLKGDKRAPNRKASIDVEVDGYKALVIGPNAPNARQKMLGAATALLDKILLEADSETADESGLAGNPAA